jgi:hypothetical protein
MAVHTQIKHATVDDLYLDPKNPRLGRRTIAQKLSQDEILIQMRRFTLEELGISIVENGYWPQEALIVVQEKSRGATHLVVVEGNRRLAACKMLKLALVGNKVPEAWAAMTKSLTKPRRRELLESLDSIPYILADSRKDVRAYLGFRHVTGIKQWDPAEKAQYINSLIDSGMTYKEVTAAIGSKVSSVRQSYISYRILLQMEDQEDIYLPAVESKFSVLTLSLRTDGVQTYLGVDIYADPEEALEPVPPNKMAHLIKFALWLFGSKTTAPLISDSRQVDRFAKVLENKKAIKYLETNPTPKLEVAYRIAGGDAAEVADAIEQSAYMLEEALATIHLVSNNHRVREGVTRLAKHVAQLLVNYPNLKALICESKKS